MLGFLIHYSSGLRLLGFQLLGFYCISVQSDNGLDFQVAP